MQAKIDFDSIKVGDKLPDCPVEISQEMINEYAEISGDFNPIHVDLEAAAKSEFKGTIAHKAYLGNFLYFFVNVDDTMIRVQVPHYLPQQEGEVLYLSLNPQKCMILF